MAQTTPSTLASIFIFESEANSWTKFEDYKPLSQLHAKFWRKDTTEEEQEWRRLNPGVQTGGPGNDCTEHDIVQGCYALDLGIEHLERSKVWIRHDYIRVYSYCNDHYDTVKSLVSGIPPSVVITGQAGLGKSYWIYYAVRRRLGEGKPFIWYRANKCFLFVEEGVFVKPLEDVDVTSFVPFLWTFVDADNSPSGFPSLLADSATKLFNIFVTCPRRERWSHLEKATNAAIVHMCPWMRGEIIQAARIHGFTDDELAEVNEMYDKYGPTPRICIDFVLSPDIALRYIEFFSEAMQGNIADLYNDIYSNGKMFDMDEVSQTIFFIGADWKQGLPNRLLCWRLEPINHAVKTKFEKEVMEELDRGSRVKKLRII